jgi:hypothetical protein
VSKRKYLLILAPTIAIADITDSIKSISTEYSCLFITIGIYKAGTVKIPKKIVING